MQKFVEGQCSFTSPSPLPHYSWASIDVLEAALLVSVVATLTKLHKAINTTSKHDSHLLAMMNSCMTRYLKIMEPAQVCCTALNIIRTGTFEGDTTSLAAALRILKRVKEEHNPILTEFGESFGEMRTWILTCREYVEKVVAMMESASGQLKAVGFV